MLVKIRVCPVLLAAVVLAGAAARAETIAKPAAVMRERSTDMTAAPPPHRVTAPEPVHLEFRPASWLQTGMLTVTIAGITLESSAGVDLANTRFTFFSTECRLTPVGPLQPRMRDGLLYLSQPGLLVPRGARGSVMSPHCEGTLTGQVAIAGGATASLGNRRMTVLLQPHERVVVKDTARLRGWLKPWYRRPGCESDDGDGDLGVRVTATPVGGDCRVDFMSPGNRDYRVDENFNMLPPGVTGVAATWRVDGDRTQCELCQVLDAPCRGANRSGGVPGPLVYQELRYGYEIREAGSALLPAIESQPPLPNGRPEVMNSYQIVIGYNRLNDWRQFLEPLYARMSCSPWAPPPTQVASGAVAAVTGRSTPVPPTAPRLRLVLEQMEFLRPAGARLPFE
jgi:hypothetical protein